MAQKAGKVGVITYDKSKVLGSGAFGTVYKGKYKTKDVAVKVSSIAGLEAKVTIAEVGVLFLSGHRPHENVLKCYGVMKEQDKAIIALELCSANLEDWVNSQGKCIHPATIDKQEVCLQTMAGVEYLHRRNIVHRDLKPPNILLSVANGRDVKVKVADFGLCKIIPESRQSITMTHVSGTPGWMPPELLRAVKPGILRSPDKLGPTKTTKIAPSMDIFSLGCIFHCLLSDGQHPFGLTYLDQLPNMMMKNPAYLNKSLKESNLILQMISDDPEKRPSAREVLGQFAKQRVKTKISIFQTVQSLDLSTATMMLVRKRSSANIEDGILKRRHFHIMYKDKSVTPPVAILRKVLSRLENAVILELDGAGAVTVQKAMISRMRTPELEALVKAEVKRCNGRALKFNLSAASGNMTSKDAEAWLKILINLDQGQLAELIREIILTKCEEQLFLIWL